MKRLKLQQQSALPKWHIVLALAAAFGIAFGAHAADTSPMQDRLDSDKVQGHDMSLNWVFDDLKKDFTLTVRNGVLTYREGTRNPKADVTVKMSKSTLDRISLRQLDFPTAMKQGDVKLEGDGAKLGKLLGMLDTFDPAFNIVTP